jgi:hypothetical protein
MQSGGWVYPLATSRFDVIFNLFRVVPSTKTQQKVSSLQLITTQIQKSR